MTHEFALLDAVIIQRHAEHEVMSCRQEVIWPDGSAIGLHPVRQHGCHSLLLRAVHHLGHWVLFRLDALVPALAAEMPPAPDRDKPGLVLYSLRAHYPSAAHCLQDVEAVAALRWPGSPRAALPMPPRHVPGRKHGTAATHAEAA